MDFQLKDVMEAVGPSAALAFAAWLFLQLLQQRYSASYARYRELVESFRSDSEGKRHQVLQEEIEIYRKRVVYMLYSTNIGIGAAILLLLALVISGLDAMVQVEWFKYVGGAAIVMGLFLVIPAAILMIIENQMIRRPIELELADLEEFQGSSKPVLSAQQGRKTLAPQ